MGRAAVRPPFFLPNCFKYTLVVMRKHFADSSRVAALIALGVVGVATAEKLRAHH